MPKHPHIAHNLTTYWDRYGWNKTKYPVGARAIRRARGGLSPEEHARHARIKGLRQLKEGWRDRIARVRSAAEGLTREELLVAIDALKKMAQKAPKLIKRSRGTLCTP